MEQAFQGQHLSESAENSFHRVLLLSMMVVSSHRGEARYAPVHLFAQAGCQLAPGPTTDVSASPSSGVLLVPCLPSGLSGESDGHRVGATDTVPYRRMASASVADSGVLELAGPAVVVCRPGHRHAAPTGRWGVLSGGGQYPQGQNWPAASVGHEGAAHRICPVWLWAARRGDAAAVGQLPGFGGF